ncbi:cardiolipin synthase [Lampropedia puyangensis]|uniref:Cardiolipin synthase n=1 Tax=Lampropedia puyangensis TaxID=1330072 RepID=A0A4S8F141_9BURK|nr:phospholipase D-like domain-containing protein [Lampropedia puyangensis]THU00667.1 cardiolipin synthase [Lampropedia puyangensis]
MYALPLSLGHLSIVCLALLLYVLTNRVHHMRRSPGSAVAWVLLLVAFPYLGVPLYLFFGLRKVTKVPNAATSLVGQEQSQKVVGGDTQPRHAPSWAKDVLSAMHIPAAVGVQALHFDADGRVALLGVLEFIERAEHELLVCTFILGNDDVVAARVVDALVLAAHRGVRVRVIVDAIGSLRLRKASMLRLEQNAVALRRFMPIWHNSVKGRANLRNHRKYMVADGRYVWSGGRNFAVEYFLDQPRHPAWQDVSFQAEGAIAQHFQALFASDWTHASAPLLWGARRVVSEALAHSAIDAFYRLQGTWQHVADLVMSSWSGAATSASAQQPHAAVLAPALQDQTLQMIASGPDQADDTIYSLLLTGVFHAKQRITMLTPYFVPDDALTAALALAVRRGVRLELLMPRTSNHRLADIARMRPLRQLAQAGAHVQWIDGMCHAKVVVIDDAMALCGSANMDTRSLFLNYEVMTAFYSLESIEAVDVLLQRLRQQAEPYEPQMPGFARDLLEGMVRSVAFEL